MSSRDIEHQRIYRKRYKKKHLLKVKEDEARHAVAQRLYPVRQPCSINGCEVIGERHHPNPDIWEEIVWLCKKHHVKEHMNQKEERKCTFKNCKNKHMAKGYCAMHYRRIFINHTLTPEGIDKRVRGQQPYCSVEGCSKPYCAKGFCEPHYRQQRKQTRKGE